MTRNAHIFEICVHGDQVSQVNNSKILAVTTLCLVDVFVKHVLQSEVHEAACLKSSCLHRYGEEEIVHGI